MDGIIGWKECLFGAILLLVQLLKKWMDRRWKHQDEIIAQRIAGELAESTKANLENLESKILEAGDKRIETISNMIQESAKPISMKLDEAATSRAETKRINIQALVVANGHNEKIANVTKLASSMIELKKKENQK